MRESHEAAVQESPPQRRLVASSRSFAPEERLDLLVHALAQLPDNVSLEVHGDDRRASAIELLAEAYGIRDRLFLGLPGDAASSAGQVVYPSTLNHATAPLPHRADRSAVVLGAPAKTNGSARTVATMAELVDALSMADDPPAAAREADHALEGQRVALVTNLPTHYRVPLFNALGARLARAGAEFRVLFTGSVRERRDWMRAEPIAFDAEFLRSGAWSARAGAVPLDLERRLRQFRPSMVVSGGFSPAVSARVAHFAARRGIAFGVWSGEIASRPTARSRLRRVERRWILRRASFAIAYGSSSAEYLRAVSPTLPVVLGRNTASFLRPPERRGDEQTVEALTVARALPEKRLDTLIRAFRLLGDLGCRLTVVGSGPSLSSLVELARGQDNVRFAGAVASDRVAEAFAGADVFLFPSSFDVFGLVLVEAFGSGCATVTSSAPGAVADLAVNDRNCIVLEGHDPGAWAQAVRALVERTELRRELGGAARATVERRWTLEHAVDAMAAGLRLGVLAGRRGGGAG